MSDTKTLVYDGSGWHEAPMTTQSFYDSLAALTGLSVEKIYDVISKHAWMKTRELAAEWNISRPVENHMTEVHGNYVALLIHNAIDNVLHELFAERFRKSETADAPITIETHGKCGLRHHADDCECGGEGGDR